MKKPVSRFKSTVVIHMIVYINGILIVFSDALNSLKYRAKWYLPTFIIFHMTKNLKNNINLVYLVST